MKEQINVRVKELRYQVLKRILDAGYGEKLWMKKKLEPEGMEPELVFYPAKDNQTELLEELEKLFEKEKSQGKDLPFSVDTKNRIPLEFEIEKYRIPFFIEVRTYKNTSLYPMKETLDKLTYYCFPIEEYIAQGFYEILNKLELLNDLSWYKEIYEIIRTEAVDGRRVRDCFGKRLEKNKIPSLEKRLDTLKSYENYGYMKKKWKNERKCHTEELPEWNEVVSLLVTFFSPIFQAVIRDEIFFEDWMPQLGRYL